MKLRGTWNDYVSAEQYEDHLETWRNLMFENLFRWIKKENTENMFFNHLVKFFSVN